MKQIVYIHGGDKFPDNDTFCKALEKRKYDPFEDPRRRRDRLTIQVQGTHQVFKPDMPNKYNAIYKARKIRFEKIFSYLNDEDLILIGHSLGGMFLLKYLGENGFPKKIKQLHLVATVIDGSDRTADKQYLGDFAFDLNIISKAEDVAEEIFIYHSTDDHTVPYSQAEKIKSYLPKAKLITFTDRGHFNTPEFPELLQNIINN